MAIANRSLDQWLSYISTQHHKEIALGLGRTKEVANRLDVLPLAPRQLIVAGTNGKGSTVRFAESLLIAQGQKVGATLSPHLERYNERVRLNGNEATDQQLVAAFEAVELARGDIPLTYYEYSVLGAFWLFREAQLDVCLLEVGLGGRLDATNIVDAQVAAVTSIGLDHQQLLGDTLELIGAEKAAVCRENQPLLLGGEMPASVYAFATTAGASVERFGEHFWYQRSQVGSQIRLGRGTHSIDCAGKPRVAWRNLALAVACVQKLTRAPTTAELNLACDQTRHPGRFEMLRYHGRQLVLDVAHNAASAAFLRRQLRGRWPNRRIIACCGFLADKDVPGIVAELAADVDHWVFAPTSGPRGLAAEAVAQQVIEVFEDKGWDNRANAVGDLVTVQQSVEAALDKAHALTGKADIILAFGSFLQVQQVRELLPTHPKNL